MLYTGDYLGEDRTHQEGRKRHGTVPQLPLIVFFLLWESRRGKRDKTERRPRDYEKR